MRYVPDHKTRLGLAIVVLMAGIAAAALAQGVNPSAGLTARLNSIDRQTGSLSPGADAGADAATRLRLRQELRDLERRSLAQSGAQARVNDGRIQRLQRRLGEQARPDIDLAPDYGARPRHDRSTRIFGAIPETDLSLDALED